jgi:hypothetical protein
LTSPMSALLISFSLLNRADGQHMVAADGRGKLGCRMQLLRRQGDHIGYAINDHADYLAANVEHDDHGKGVVVHLFELELDSHVNDGNDHAAQIDHALDEGWCVGHPGGRLVGTNLLHAQDVHAVFLVPELESQKFPNRSDGPTDGGAAGRCFAGLNGSVLTHAGILLSLGSLGAALVPRVIFRLIDGSVIGINLGNSRVILMSLRCKACPSCKAYNISAKARDRVMTVTGSTAHSQGRIRQEGEEAELRTKECAARAADFAC